MPMTHYFALLEKVKLLKQVREVLDLDERAKLIEAIMATYFKR